MPQSRTPLLRALQDAFRKSLTPEGEEPDGAAAASAPAPRPGDYDRRRFLLDALKAGTLVGAAGALWPVEAVAQLRGTQPVIAIVGGGLAGLNAAYQLKKAGLAATVYEAGAAPGGRIHTARDLLGQGLTTEVGGEFVDSSHADVLTLIAEFGLPRFDTLALTERRLVRDDYFINGRRYTEREVVNAFRPFARRIRRANDALPEDSYGDSPRAVALDRLSIEEYLNRLGVRGWFRDLLDVAFTSEFGLDTGQQSALNFITMIGTDTSQGKFQIFGDSDERFKISGGNDTLIRELARRLEGGVKTGHKLHALSESGGGYSLNFGDRGEVRADYVILAVPFTILRQVELRVALPPRKKLAIEQLGYGTNSKLLLGFRERTWRSQGYSGYLFNDVVQNGWDNSQMQLGNRGVGGYTVYLGGTAGVNLDADKRSDYLSALDGAYPGARAQFNDRHRVVRWHKYELVQGSYACYKVGQWSTISGVEGEPVGNLFFAGEHCSGDFQGYMNGAAETGRTAAEAIIRKVVAPARRRPARRRAR